MKEFSLNMDLSDFEPVIGYDQLKTNIPGG